MCTAITTNDQDQALPVPENEVQCSEKTPLSLELLQTVGITENCVDAAISTLERISELLLVGKYEWVNRCDKTKSKLNRLKWATKKFTSGIDIRNDVQCKRNNSISKAISKRSGICRLRKEKGVRTKRLYEGENLSKICPKIPNVIIAEENEETVSNSCYPTARKCYVCKARFTKVHTFYDQMCTPCAEFNYSKRSQSADLTGKVALVTGGRIKIGYEVVLKLLRCGISRVIITTRFPQDAAKRYSNEPDYETWKERLDIYGLDLRFLGTVEKFCAHVIKKYPRLDILIQNAAQTVRRPPAFYAHLIREEVESLELSPLVKTFQNNSMVTMSVNAVTSGTLALNNPFESIVSPSDGRLFQCSSSALTSQLIIHPDDRNIEENKVLFPPGQFDEDHQQIDLRVKNSWLLETPEVDTTELVEVSIVNSMAPFVILSKLSPLLKNSVKLSKVENTGDCGWVILVSAMEGQFYRQKSTQHPHTNCAKASLNMLVRTSAEYYEKFGIFMNSVDTGWVTDEVPVRARQQWKGNLADFVPPLDEIDGAARILDPIFQTVNCGVKEFGKFYKDYKETVW